MSHLSFKQVFLNFSIALIGVASNSDAITSTALSEIAVRIRGYQNTKPGSPEEDVTADVTVTLAFSDADESGNTEATTFGVAQRGFQQIPLLPDDSNDPFGSSGSGAFLQSTAFAQASFPDVFAFATQSNIGALTFVNSSNTDAYDVTLTIDFGFSIETNGTNVNTEIGMASFAIFADGFNPIVGEHDEVEFPPPEPAKSDAKQRRPSFFLDREETAIIGFGVSATAEAAVSPELPPVIPEPSTYLLFAIGILSIIGIGYRQRKKAA